MKHLRKSLALLLALLPVFLFSGCWDYHEVENYNIVAGFAIDNGQNGYKYHLTFECLKLEGDQKSGGVKPLIVESDGNTVFEAVRSAMQESSRKLYFSHCRIAIISSDLAASGILPLLDWLQRDAEPRITLDLLISKEKTAGEILKQEPQTDQLTSYQISKALNEAATSDASTNDERLFEVNNILSSEEGTSLTLPAVKLQQEGDVSTPRISGTAVFRGDRLVGWLDQNASMYLLFLLGKISGGLFLTGLHPADNNITLEILSSNTSVKPVLSGDSVTMNIQVSFSAAYGEQNSRQDLLSLYPLHTFELSAAQTLKNGIENVIATVQQKYSADIFGFGTKIYQNDPRDWNRFRSNWDEKFKTVKCSVTTRVEIKNTAAVPAKRED